ncbi:MAG: SDR family NAD(P)-dependent oxidoreductase [Gammaproteobacteria bacterium]|nr:SDR family NAD(P)-dependent oxidoreductase [Gammaproteobacteria bacterium]
MDANSKPPPSQFGSRSTAEQVTRGLDLGGKTVLITGCNSGLGLESMRVLAQRGAHVVGAARSIGKAEAAAAGIGADITPVACELSDLESVAAAADAVRALGRPIDVLMCNAGIMALPKLRQKNGLELQFLTNHLGHFVLVNRLLDRVKEAPAGRIVVVSSLAHYFPVPGGINFDNLSGDRNYVPFTFYGQSKLANLLMSNELARRLLGSRATSNAIHPGIIHTPLMRNLGDVRATLGRILSWPVSRSVERGAATQCYVATAPGLEGLSGHYFADCNPARMSAHGRDREMAARLWAVSEELAGDYLS